MVLLRHFKIYICLIIKYVTGMCVLAVLLLFHKLNL